MKEADVFVRISIFPSVFLPFLANGIELPMDDRHVMEAFPCFFLFLFSFLILNLISIK